MTTAMVRLLLMPVCGFAALSSSAATALGLEEARILFFTAFLLALLAVPFLARPVLARPSGPVLLLPVLLAAMVLSDAGNFDPIDAKIVLPLLVLLAVPDLARHVTAQDLSRQVRRMLALYIALTFVYQLLADPAAIVRGHDGIERYDPTGSVVMHSSLCLIALVLAGARLLQPTATLGARLVALAIALMALAMILMAATRTVLVTLCIFMLMLVMTAAERGSVLRGVVAAACGGALAFAGYTLLINDSFFLRLTGGQGDFSSGRWSSIVHWLALAADQPWGLGLGAVREMLAEGRPALDGTTLLEWPHNELVRFYVEAGPIGLLFVLLLLGLLVRRALYAGRLARDASQRALLLIIAADLLAEALLQNLLNAIYHATVLILVLTLMAAAVTEGEEEVSDEAEPSLDKRPRECLP